MNTTFPIKTADKLKATIERGYKKSVIAKHLGIPRQTFNNRLKDNSFQDSELLTLKRLGFI